MKPVAAWARPFDDPVLLPGGRELVTLRDAADNVMKLPKAEQDPGEWQAAVEALLLVVELNGPTASAKSGPARGLSITLRSVVPELTRNASIQLTKRFSLQS